MSEKFLFIKQPLALTHLRVFFVVILGVDGILQILFIQKAPTKRTGAGFTVFRAQSYD